MTKLEIIEALLFEKDEAQTTANQNVAHDHPFTIGQNYFIRLVTYHIVGRLVSVGEKELVLEDAAWVADSGRLSEALITTGEFSEVEMLPKGPFIVGRGAMVGCAEFDHKLPTETK